MAAVVAVVLAGLLVSTWLIDRNAVRDAVVTQIRDATGLEVAVKGATDISIFPSAHVVLHEVSLKGGAGDQAPLTTTELRANLRLLPLLTGRYHVANLSLVEPQVNVIWGDDGHSNWAPILQTFANAMKPNADRALWFSDVTLTDGTLVYRNDANHVYETISDIDLKFSLPSALHSFSASGQSTWHNERLDGNFSIADFIAAVAGEKSGLKVRLSGAPLKLSFDGTMTNKTSMMLEGALNAEGNSLRDTMRWIGRELPGENGFGPFALKARANVVGDSVALTNVVTSLDGNATEGVLTFNSITGQQTLQGTLAADALDLTPYIGTIRLLASGARDWNRQAFDLSALTGTNLDIRLSAGKVTIGSSKLGRTAFGANLRNGALALSVGEAQLFGGLVRGSLSIDRADNGASLKAQFGLSDVDLNASANELFAIRGLRGRGDMTMTLEASGASPFALAQSLDGTATLTGHDGEISGLNIEQLLRRLERRPLSGAGNFRSGNTPFDTLKLAVSINDGMATATDVQIDSATTHVVLTGTASIPSREYDLKGNAVLKSANPDAPEFQLPFVVQGPWDDPLIFPDSDILIRRSTVTAPLLDSLKDRKTRDAVKAVIDRLSGKKPEDASPPADQGAPSSDPAAAAPQPTPAPDANAPAAVPTPPPSTPN
jgi:AsmA protein